MKILLAQNASYCPALGGANRSNRTLLEALHARGHECRVVATAVAGYESDAQLAVEGARLIEISEERSVIDCAGITIHAARVRATMDSARLKRELLRQIREFDPDWILVSTEDVGQMLLEVAVTQAAEKVVYLARTTLYLPFGPDCFNPAPDKTELLRHVAGIAVVGDFVKDYFRQWANLDAEVLPISLFGQGPFPDYGNFAQGYVTMVNPCAYKGISIFLDLARSFPHIDFAAVPTWGTTSDDMQALMRQKNIKLLEPVEDMNRIFSRTRVMLVPSLWAEAKSRTIVEAMLRGIPVMASDVGGNREAKLGVDHVLPVTPIAAYQQVCDERSLPVTVVPEQDCQPWRDALQRLLSDEAHYREVSQRSRQAAGDYVAQRGGAEKVEAFLQTLQQRKASGIRPVFPAPKEDAAASLTAGLSPAQRALLALRMKQKSQARPPDA